MISPPSWALRGAPSERPSPHTRLAEVEVPRHVRDDLPVGRMIDGLDPHDPLREDALVLVQVPEELELRRRRPHDEDLLGIAEGIRDIVEEAAQVVGMMALLRRTFFVAADVTAGRADRRLVEALG